MKYKLTAFVPLIKLLFFVAIVVAVISIGSFNAGRMIGVLIILAVFIPIVVGIRAKQLRRLRSVGNITVRLDKVLVAKSC